MLWKHHCELKNKCLIFLLLSGFSQRQDLVPDLRLQIKSRPLAEPHVFGETSDTAESFKPKVTEENREKSQTAESTLPTLFQPIFPLQPAKPQPPPPKPEPAYTYQVKHLCHCGMELKAYFFHSCLVFRNFILACLACFYSHASLTGCHGCGGCSTKWGRGSWSFWCNSYSGWIRVHGQQVDRLVIYLLTI